ncbi:preprotein translocase subunit SecE [Arenimonas donghaensis]|uniref:Protein translocase subunit SecE n=1 Tax=Arenimonas donghaensis DSM 18148 = HO3-R19 TaxID=1121014 RepID=A0A087MHL9_9GAMM|nr:preprotein translocase subunit SecE [Arenimonas donghaensis]KFL36372.1 hypothetical protein N788_13455 [Arenimonas donghaensis DSM 18148 = HO3-R19]
MNTKVEHSQQAASPADVAKYVLAAAVLVGSLVAFYYFGQWPGLLRGLMVAAAVVVAGAIVAFTAKGEKARDFISESMFELRKVVWPTRQETTRTTGMVLVVVVIVALVLSGFDMVISWLIRLLLGQ